MMVHSVMAVIPGRHHQRDHLALNAAEWPGGVHQLTIEIVVQPHRPRMHSVDTQYVVLVGNPLRFGNVDVVDKRHDFLQLSAILSPSCLFAGCLAPAATDYPESITNRPSG